MHDWVRQPLAELGSGQTLGCFPQPSSVGGGGLGWNILVFCGSAQPLLSRIPAVCTILRSRAGFQDSTESGLSATCWGRASDP